MACFLKFFYASCLVSLQWQQAGTEVAFSVSSPNFAVCIMLCHFNNAMQCLTVNITGLQLISDQQDHAFRSMWGSLTGSAKKGPWKWVPAQFSKSVRLLDTTDAHPDIGLLGRGGGGRGT